MNNVNLYGRIATELKFEATSKKDKEKGYCRFLLAVRDGVDADGEQKTQFISCIAWNQLAKTISDYMKKGDRFALTGKINVQKYEDEDGEERTSFQIVVSQVYFVETKETETKSSKRKR